MDNQIPTERLWCSVADWVRLSGDAERRVRQQISDGELKAVREGKRILIDVEAAKARKQQLPSAARRLSPTARGR